MECIIAKERFQHSWQQRARSVEHSEGAKEYYARDGEVAVAQGPKVYDRAGVTRFPKDQASGAEDEQGGERLDASEGIAKPIPLLSLQ